MNFRGSRYEVGRNLAVTNRAAELRLALRFYLFELSRWKSVNIIHFKIEVFSGPNIQVSENVVQSVLEVV
jgi:hypothetical protein